MGLKTYLGRVLRYIRHGVPNEVHISNNTTANIIISASSGILQDKRILITGGGRGLGFAFAKRCIEEGAKVIITGRNEETLKKACEILGENVKYIVHDVCDVSKNRELFQKAQKMLGNQKINSLISNAGISLHEGDFRNVTEKDWDAQMDTNLKGNFFIVSEFIKYLEFFDDKSGNIVVITSERGKRPDDIPYGLTKVATSSFVQAIASKVINEGIRVNAVGPGVTTSDMTGFKEDGNLYAGWQNYKRVLVPEEIAEVVNFLLSDVSNCISGEVIICNRGNHIVHW